MAPLALTDTIFAWAGERRGFTLVRVTEADLPAPLPAPTEAEVQAWYDAHLADYTRPEAKRITYAALLPADVAKTITIDEAEVKAAYDARLSEFMLPENAAGRTAGLRHRGRGGCRQGGAGRWRKL